MANDNLAIFSISVRFWTLCMQSNLFFLFHFQHLQTIIVWTKTLIVFVSNTLNIKELELHLLHVAFINFTFVLLSTISTKSQFSFFLFPELQISVVLLTSIDSTCVISSPNPMFDHLVESSRWDDSNKWSNIGFGEEIGILGNKKRSLSGALLPSW